MSRGGWPEATGATPVPIACTLADYRGHVVVLNVWRTDCPPCRQEMPSLEHLHRAFASRGLQVVAVSVDGPATQDEIGPFLEQFGLTFDVVHDGRGDIQGAYQTTGVPETFVIGRDGTIRKKVIGADDWNSRANRALIATLLDEEAGEPIEHRRPRGRRK